MESSNKPIRVFRAAGLTASVFRNAGQNGSTFHKVSLQKTYRDGEQFKQTTSLSRDDLPVAALLLQRAWEAIVEAEEAKPSEEA